MRTRAGLLAGLLVALVACAGGNRQSPASVRDEPRREKPAGPPVDNGAEAERERRRSLDEARRKVEEEFQRYLNERREQERQREAVRRAEEERRREEGAEADAMERQKQETKREQERHEERERLVREARAARNTDRKEAGESERDEAIYARSLGPWRMEARKASRLDLEEDAFATREIDEARTRGESEARLRQERLERVDTDRQRYYRLESEGRFPRRLEVVEAASRQVQLFKNRNPLQFMAYSGGKRRTDVTPVALPGSESPVRLHLYEFLKGRPGNYVLLNAQGEPVLIAHGGVRYRIVNIRTDGQAMLLVDLESEDLGEYHRISVDGVDLLME